MRQSEADYHDMVARLTDTYDDACYARAERERHHTLYQLSSLLAKIERENAYHLNISPLADDLLRITSDLAHS